MFSRNSIWWIELSLNWKNKVPSFQRRGISSYPVLYWLYNISIIFSSILNTDKYLQGAGVVDQRTGRIYGKEMGMYLGKGWPSEMSSKLLKGFYRVGKMLGLSCMALKYRIKTSQCWGEKSFLVIKHWWT